MLVYPTVDIAPVLLQACGAYKIFWNLFSDTSDTVRLTELGKIYLELGYLTKSLQVHSRALDIAKELDSDKAKHQVNLWESPVILSISKDN